MGDSFTKVNEIISPEKLILLRKKNFEKKIFKIFSKFSTVVVVAVAVAVAVSESWPEPLRFTFFNFHLKNSSPADGRFLHQS